MMSPQEPDDGWADLARELGLETPADVASRSDSQTYTEPADDEGLAHADAFEDGLEDEDAAEEAMEGEADDGAPKKKKKRRRRRKKRAGTEIGESPQPLESESEEDASDEQGDWDSTVTEDQELQESEATEPDRGWANWDVPSWEEIVAGLYRPNR
jgi:hypothetical protein